MRKLVTVTFVTLDGVMQAPGAPDEDESGDFTAGGWAFNYWDEVLDQAMGAIFARQPELVLGRKTYDIFAAYWSQAQNEPEADNLNNAQKYVASRTLTSVDWNNSTLLEGDVVDAITRLKEQDGPELQVHGSGNLIQTLLRHNLIDAMHVMIFPVTIGQGKRLFGEGTQPAGFKLRESKIAGSGVIIATYERSGELQTGSFA